MKSRLNDFQEEMLPILEAGVKRGEVRADDFATLFDRVRVHRGEPQRYGTQFEIKDKRLVANRIEDIAKLDSLRASVGMVPLAEYVKLNVGPVSNTGGVATAALMSSRREPTSEA